MINFFRKSAKKQEPKVAVIDLDKNIFMLAEQVGRSRWMLSYFLVGKFGNYLIGLPKRWEAFDLLFRKNGGLAYLLPTHRLLEHESMCGLFNLFGLQIIAAPKMKCAFPQVSTCQLFSSMKVKAIKSKGLDLDWLGRFNDTTFTTARGLESDKEVDLYFPRFYLGEISKFCEDSLDGSGQELADPERLTAKLDKHFEADNLVTWQIPGTNIIACYDDLDFDRNDADFLGPLTRKSLATSLVKAGAKIKSGNVWTWDSIDVNFTHTGLTLASSPLDGIQIDPYSVWLMTATEAAFFLYNQLRVDTDILNHQLLKLAEKLPYNVAKLEAWIGSHENKSVAQKMSSHLKLTMEPTVQHFRQFRVIGLQGKRRNIE